MLFNVLTGFLILFYEPFRIKNRITVSNIVGKVIDIHLRYKILQKDCKQIMVPNFTVLKNLLTTGD
ncbi:mechanosensitive ion channel domain-containing protein [Coxiella-like endosymbiont]|uniref:mechanosensitive ion channel domain-containing protein n=1 Tax=Coxiella-like endosymbiont TaxID=1592897 RepID=UPI00272C6F96|nr:mechanosensitive ion channel domain-containing protein [Coxiella-like endosymbiont]